jgi:hypothetical protein
MGESNTSAPDKNQPHPFQAGPEVPGDPRSGAMQQETAATDGEVVHQPSAAKCALCGLHEDDQIHVEGKAEADTESLHWG